MENLTLMAGLPRWVVVLVALALAALLIYQFQRQRGRVSPQRNGLLIFLRACVYTLLVFFLLGPVLTKEQVTKLHRSLVVLVDTSKSMGLPAGKSGSKEKSRIELAKEKLLGGRDPILKRLARDYDLRFYQFNTELEPIGLGALPGLTAQGRGTRLFEALWQVTREPRGAAGILLLSDGIANGIERLEGFRSFPLPVFAVAVGETEGFTDLRIATLQAPEFAFRGREFSVEFTIRAHGLAGRKVPLYFHRGRNLISARPVLIDRDPFEQHVRLTYTPREVGPHSFTLDLPVQPGEEIIENNHREWSLDVQRDKIRVLSLSGSPSWNYRFLRMALKQDPFIDLVSFVFLRTPFDTVDVPENQLSLIPFPIEEIFLKELRNFDVVILENFSYRSYFNALYLERVRDFVHDGGGLAMLGGIRSFDTGGYSESPLSEPLPVELDGRGAYETGTPLRTVLTPAGRAHPITRIFPEPKANEKAWKKVHPLSAINQVARPKGEVLLSAVPAGAGEGWPLLIVGKFGKGRTLALMSDDLWRWNFMAVGDKENPQTHLKLVRQAMRWLAREPSFDQVQIKSLSGSESPGEKMEFRIQVLRDDFTPTNHADLQLRVTGPDGETVPLEIAPEKQGGIYRAEFTPSREGSYRLEAQATLSGKILGRAKQNFLVSLPYGETEDGRPRPDLLRKISEMSHGSFLAVSRWDENTPEDLLAAMEKLAPPTIVRRQQTPLWSNPWAFALMLLLLGSEWWLRRSWGLV